jgi:hypothetical protein
MLAVTGYCIMRVHWTLPQPANCRSHRPLLHRSGRISSSSLLLLDGNPGTTQATHHLSGQQPADTCMFAQVSQVELVRNVAKTMQDAHVYAGYNQYHLTCLVPQMV